MSRAAISGAAAAPLAVPLVVPASVLGREGAAAPGERVAVAMIGMGRQACQVSLKQFLEMPEVEVVAVSDVDVWRLQNAKAAVEKGYGEKRRAEYKGCAAAVDFRELLARKDIDAVMISTPDHWHAPMALEALEAGKDVSLEKPITRTIAEGRALSDAAARLGRIFRVDSELRSAPSVHRAAEIVRNGRIGKVTAVKVGVPGSDVGCPPQADMPVPEGLDYERWQGPAPRAPYTLNRVHPVKSYGRPGWMRHLYYCDGMVTNWGTHLLDGAMWCLDLDRAGPVEIEGTGKFPPAESFWNVLLEFEVTYRFSDGVVWTYRTERPYFRLEGEEGWVEASFDFLKAEPASLLEWRVPAGGWTVERKSDKQDFIDGVRSRKPTLEPAEVGHRVTSLCHLGHIAIQVGEKLRWDPGKEVFSGSERANELVRKPILEPRRG
jgi:predicted dehydrogenase